MDYWDLYYDLELMIERALTTEGLDKEARYWFVQDCEDFKREIRLKGLFN